jgi:ribosomal protein L23
MLNRLTILRPLINEKSMALLKGDFYTFEVTQDATKQEIAKLVADKFKVDCLKIQIVNLKAKRKSQRSRRGYFHTSPTKKAIVKIKKGQKILLFEQVANEEQEVEVRTAEGEVMGKTKEKKSLLRGTKVRVERQELDESKDKKEEASEKQVSASSKRKGEK